MTHHQVLFSKAEGMPIFPLMSEDAVSEDMLSKGEEREQLNAQIEAFLTSGGKINFVEPNVMADPPKKPTSNYGSQPI